MQFNNVESTPSLKNEGFIHERYHCINKSLPWIDWKIEPQIADSSTQDLYLYLWRLYDNVDISKVVWDPYRKKKYL